MAGKIGTLFLLLTFSEQIFSELTNLNQSTLKYYRNFIEELHNHYQFSEIVITFPENSSEILDYITKIPDILYNIHKSRIALRLEKPSFNENQLLIMIACKEDHILNTITFGNFYNFKCSKMFIVIEICEFDYFRIKSQLFINTILLKNGNAFKYLWFAKKPLSLINCVEDFIFKDSYNFPEANFPLVDFIIIKHYEDNFPLVSFKGSSNSDRPTGLVAYMNYEFKEYFNNRILTKNLKFKNYEKEVLRLQAEVDYEYVSQRTYPVMSCNFGFLLPVQDDDFSPNYLQKPFNLSGWTKIAFMTLYLSIMLRFAVFQEISTSFLEILTLSLGSSYKGCTISCTRSKMIYLQLFVYTFVIVNIYNAKISSFLSARGLGRSLETIEDILKSKIQIWYYFDENQMTNLHTMFPRFKEVFYKTLRKTFLYSTNEKFFENLLIFNTSQGYLIGEFTWTMIDRYQKLMRKKHFSFSKNLVFIKGLVYTMIPDNIDTNLNDISNEFLLRVKESGLDYIWEQFSLKDLNFKFLKTETKLWMPLTMEYLGIGWWIVSGGFTISLLSFFIELLFNYKFLNK